MFPESMLIHAILRMPVYWIRSLSWGYWISLLWRNGHPPKNITTLTKKGNSFICKVLYQPVVKGTSVSRGVNLEPYLPCFIVKRNQLLISLSSIDFSFIMEENISEIFSLFHEFKLKVNLIQNTAISFSVCVEDKFDNFNELNAIFIKKIQSRLQSKCNFIYH
jgi:hypothetical protein